ncbi:hypothetical protein QNH36_01910 [Mesobacillus sp. AQ2]|jgi:hypothetical protein|uniref:hypothetical protein n=1 Tax=Bacillaceae TaxID=186817 RepID=UPI0011A37322|nr:MULTISPECIES: hypothetical protein [Bacillaceae]MCM3125183.1 hypothetical protein [Mesobacillus sp. MER 33]MCM3235386.1 hypothetical protein [Mesobacillus sp. MER 48]WHX40940.1 hypothetical protein QNH36_01910 [Mesobacillus sp. AQ2]
MHPITVIEILLALGLLLLILGVGYFLPRNRRKTVIKIVLIVIVLELAFFGVRPLWIDYHREIKTEQLSEYLNKRYPGEKFEISYPTSRSYSPYQMQVRFANEPGWIYSYFVNKDEIKQVDIGVPDVELPEEGDHYEDLGD